MLTPILIMNVIDRNDTIVVRLFTFRFPFSKVVDYNSYAIFRVSGAIPMHFIPYKIQKCI